MKAQIIKTVYFEAARRLSGSHSNANYTGNSYRIDLIAEGEVDDSVGWVVDYGEMKRFLDPVRKKLDHCCLSDIPELAEDATPAALENWIKEQLRPWPDWFADVRVSLPAPPGFILEHISQNDALGLPERVMFTFSAAQSLPQLPEGHPCRKLHGHTYQVEIAPARIAGIENTAKEVFNSLDATYLNLLPGLEQATAERIAVWIWRFLEKKGVTPEVVAVQETPHNRCHYFGK